MNQSSLLLHYQIELEVIKDVWIGFNCCRLHPVNVMGSRRYDGGVQEISEITQGLKL